MLSANTTAAKILDGNSTIGRLRPVRVPSWVRAGMGVASAIAPGTAARVAHKLFFTPPRTALRDEERRLLARGESFMAGPDSERVVGRTWGQGPAVLLVHGWGGHAGQMTPFVDPLVAAGFRAIAIDLPGHGESAGRVSSLVHGASALARTASLFGPLHGLVAHSFGAAISTYAMSLGQTVERAVFVAPPARFESFWVRFRVGVGISSQVMDRMLQGAEDWLQVRFEGIFPVDLASRMAAPLLVLHDPEDREVPFEEGAELASRWPGAVLQRAERLGHLRILRDPGSIAAAVHFLTA
jgi:pimeloyl-ACP methyl ester carboxylesterase